MKYDFVSRSMFTILDTTIKPSHSRMYLYEQTQTRTYVFIYKFDYVVTLMCILLWNAQYNVDLMWGFPLVMIYI